MLRITFKAVGQGDSILIEWADNQGFMHIGIIDCNLVNGGRSPVLEYIKQSGYRKIEFLVLSHPHSDHFSGFFSLLEYCESEAIQLGVFYHSCHAVPDYLKAASQSITSSREAFNLFHKILQLYKEEKMDKKILDQTEYPILELSNMLKIKCLSPSERERDSYISNKKYYYNEEADGNNPKANLLSSILKIYCEEEDWYVLLTADADASTFLRLDKKHKSEFEGELILAQCPHHGSRLNCKRVFWKNKKKATKCYVAFSVGENKYGHPNQWTKDTFIENGFLLRFTTDMSKLNRSETSETASRLLSSFSQPVSFESDLAFEIQRGGAVREIMQ